MTGEIFDRGGAEGEEAKRIHELVRENAVKEGFGTFKLQFGEDSTGDPAVWIWFEIDPKYSIADDSIKTLTRLRRLVRSALLAAGIHRIPYVRFKESSAVAS
jgi:hypothetical protein